MNNKTIMILTALCLSNSAYPETTITSAEIIENSVIVSCIDWQVTGTCLWLRCTMTGCSVETSIKVRHYLPEAVVQVYASPEDAPWQEMAFITDSLSLDQVGGYTNSVRSVAGNDRRTHAKLVHKESSVIGSPGLIPVSEFLGSMEYFCKSTVTPFMPYYSSGIDQYSWKYPYADFLQPGTFIPGMNEVGEREDGESRNFLFSGRFGNVYPRIGALVQTDDYRAAAVMAQRTADIVTDPYSMHLYNYLGRRPNQGGQGEWPPGKIEEWTSKEGKWQMLTPYLDSSCHIFGESSTRQSNYGVEDPYSHRRSDNGAYSLHLWRPTSCCARKGQTLIGVIDIEEK
ncbi:TIGR03756 family integrating conjugative element protein [Vibrio fluvialis]|nr:TIGR03756 family integrating conjugative element protein [Vibrio fluvialis]